VIKQSYVHAHANVGCPIHFRKLQLKMNFKEEMKTQCISKLIRK